jgi:hypothetical protein
MILLLSMYLWTKLPRLKICIMGMRNDPQAQELLTEQAGTGINICFEVVIM